MKISSFFQTIIIALAFSLFTATLPATAQTTAAPAETLFHRLGGFDAVAAVTDDFLERLATDPQLGRFFLGQGNDSKMRTRQHVVNFICNATGGPCFYTGRTMVLTHKGMGITAEDWEISMGHLVGTLDKFQVPSPEREEVIAFIDSLRPTIVDAEIGTTAPAK
ncbi:MAG: group 1 truncated hemoglobin [Syntrophobacteraceae bacterium]